MKRLLVLLLLHIVIVLQAVDSMAQSFKAEVTFDEMNVGDTTIITYSFSGDTEDIKSFPKIDVSPLLIVAGPYQSQSSSILIRNGKTTNQKMVSVSYYAVAKKESDFILKPLAIRTRDGKVYTSNKIRIKVRPGKRHIAKSTSLMNPQVDFFEPDLDFYTTTVIHDFERLDTVQFRIDTIHQPMLLITGWVYRAVESRKYTDSLLEAVNRFMLSKQGVELVDTIKDKQLPRNYYGLQDTLGLREHLESIYKKAGPGNKFVIRFAEPRDWGLTDEYHVFGIGNNIWSLIYGMMANKVNKPLLGTNKTHELLMGFRFRSENKRIKFCTVAEQEGYKIVNGKTSNEGGEGFYEVQIIKSCPMNEESIYSTIERAVAISSEKESWGIFYGLGINKAKGKK